MDVGMLDAGVDPAQLSHAERIDLLRELARVRSQLEALEARALAALSRSDTSEKQWVRDEVACAMRIAPATAVGRLHDAQDLVELFPSAFAALADARITGTHARALLELARPLPEEVRAAVESRVLVRADHQTVGQFRQSVRRAVAALDPRGQQDKHDAALLERRVVFTPVADGMCELWALLPADAAVRLRTVLDRCAQRTAAISVADDRDPAAARDERTADQRRADALADLIDLADLGTRTAIGSTGTASADRLPTGHRAGGAPSIRVTIAASTLLGLDDHPGDLDGYGPVPAALARRIADDPTGRWRRLVHDPAGRLLELGPNARIPARLAEHVAARDRTCRFPGCRRSATRCEIDHRIPRSQGGPTTEDNLHALCSRHHHLKHEAPGWAVWLLPDGSTEWRTPTGHRALSPPDDLVGELQPTSTPATETSTASLSMTPTPAARTSSTPTPAARTTLTPTPAARTPLAPTPAARTPLAPTSTAMTPVQPTGGPSRVREVA